MTYAILAGLLLSHMIADYALQSNWMAQNKHTDKDALTAHALVHGSVTIIVLVGFDVYVTIALVSGFYITFLHGMIDAMKLHIRWDQTAHLLIILALWVVFTL